MAVIPENDRAMEGPWGIWAEILVQEYQWANNWIGEGAVKLAKTRSRYGAIIRGNLLPFPQLPGQWIYQE